MFVNPSVVAGIFWPCSSLPGRGRRLGSQLSPGQYPRGAGNLPVMGVGRGPGSPRGPCWHRVGAHCCGGADVLAPPWALPGTGGCGLLSQCVWAEVWAPWHLRGAGAGGGRCPRWGLEDSSCCLGALRLARESFPCPQLESGLVGLSSSALTGVSESLASSALTLE